MPNSDLSQLFPMESPERSDKFQFRIWLPSFALVIVLVIGIFIAALQPVSTEGIALDRVITIPPGLTGIEIANLLHENGIIKDANLFRFLLRVTQTDAELQAGHYLLSPAMRPMEVIETLQAGEILTYIVSIPEGFELKTIAQTLAYRGLVDYERFMELALNAELVYGDNVPLDLPIASLEGYLFPDTYRFAVGQTEEDIIRLMVARFLEVVPPAVEPFLEGTEFTLHEIITLASIVEKEIMVDRERPIVASVYLNRLKIGMPLQADPTVRYVMTEDRSRVLYRDLEIDSPYNTYLNRGLPPGPIASPGLASIMGVLQPAETEYLFFVSRRDGTHHFSKTFEEHVQARRTLGY